MFNFTAILDIAAMNLPCQTIQTTNNTKNPLCACFQTKWSSG